MQSGSAEEIVTLALLPVLYRHELSDDGWVAQYPSVALRNANYES